MRPSARAAASRSSANSGGRPKGPSGTNSAREAGVRRRRRALGPPAVHGRGPTEAASHGPPSSSSSSSPPSPAYSSSTSTPSSRPARNRPRASPSGSAGGGVPVRAWRRKVLTRPVWPAPGGGATGRAHPAGAGYPAGGDGFGGTAWARRRCGRRQARCGAPSSTGSRSSRGCPTRRRPSGPGASGRRRRPSRGRACARRSTTRLPAPQGARAPGRLARRARRGRGLPGPQRVDAGGRRRAPAGAGVGARRGLHHRLGLVAPLRRHGPGPAGRRGGGDGEPPPRRARLPAPGRAGRAGAGQLGQRRPARPGGRPGVGARQHRRLRGRRRQRHRVRRIGRGRQDLHPAGHAGGPQGSTTGPSCRAAPA